jgi:hypothetical protein
MSGNKLSDTIRNASTVNMRYTARLLNLGREYVKAFSDALVAGASDAENGGSGKKPGAPLLLAGRTGETANAAFSVSGGASLPSTLTLKVNGEFGDTKVWVEPETLSLQEGKAEITRILARIGKKTEPNTDFAGEVVIAEMNRKVTDFVLRKLPDR